MDSEPSCSSQARLVCKYGNKDDKEDEEDGCPPAKKVAVDSSLQQVPPLFYVTKVRGIDEHYNSSSLAISLKDILAMGELVASAQVGVIPLDVLYHCVSHRATPLLLVHGEHADGLTRLKMACKPFPNISLFQAPLKIPYGTHHSKMMLLLLDCGMRVVIHTANLIEKDWDQKTQGAWVSPLFPKEPSGPSTFQKDLLDYLTAYGGTGLDVWKQHIREHNMDAARVHLIASVPGAHTSSSMHQWGHMKLRKVLSQHGPPASRVDKDWTVIGQFSSVGSLGTSSSQWLCSEWLTSLSACREAKLLGARSFPQLQLIFPSVENVRSSLEGYMAGGSIPYDRKVAEKQSYLTGYLWVSPDCTQLAWFLVTSANLSKAAWGAMEKQASQLKIRSYEIGVLFLPTDDGLLSVATHLDSFPNPEIAVPVPYDLPLTQYGKKDRPWMWNGTYTEPDSHGRVWTPP
ncbi:hypothetical protein EMCRGX_G032262 [Ephydatia muelleri]